MGGEVTMTIPKGGRLTEAEALDREVDMLPVLTSVRKMYDLACVIQASASEIEALVARHLRIAPGDLEIAPLRDWIWGGFNVCIVVRILNPRGRRELPPRALLRIPMPHAVGDDFHPGNADEKLRCEAAIYAWLRDKCPSVPIPRLLGMGFPGTRCFTAIDNESTWNWLVWRLRRAWASIRGGTLAPYHAHRRHGLLDHGYLLLEFVEKGEMLSNSWIDHFRDDERRRANLYRSLARIMLSFAAVPLPRIGSWRMDDRGFISLSNRPLFDLTLLWERDGIATDVPRNRTYVSPLSLMQDMISLQDNRMRQQPNSILSKRDGLFQLGALVGLRALLPRFWNDAKVRQGPFVLRLPDLHQSNIFVDKEWNITSLIDLEFAPVCPVQMWRAPTWLTGSGIDGLTGAHLEEYKVQHDLFVDTVEAEETALRRDHAYSQMLRGNWTSGRLWHNMALGSINAFPAIYEQHLQPMFFTKEYDRDTDGKALAQLWDTGVMDFIDRKVNVDLVDYERRIRALFAAEAPATNGPDLAQKSIDARLEPGTGNSESSMLGE